MGDKKEGGNAAGGGLAVPVSICNKCGRNQNDQNGTLDSGFCNCKRMSDCNIRLGPVPDSAFRPPSPLPARASIAPQFTKEELQAMSTGNTQGTKYEIVSIREKHGEFRKAIPCMPFFLAVILCLINVVLPGIGTFIAGLTVLCGCRTEHESKRTSLGYNIVAAILQLVTCPLIVGWIWSVLWGITFVNVSGTTDGNLHPHQRAKLTEEFLSYVESSKDDSDSTSIPLATNPKFNIRFNKRLRACKIQTQQHPSE